MKTSHIIILMGAATLLILAVFGLAFHFASGEPGPATSGPATVVEQEGETPTLAETTPAMQLDAFPGVTKTRENLSDIQRGRESLNEYAGEDGAEKY